MSELNLDELQAAVDQLTAPGFLADGEKMEMGVEYAIIGGKQILADEWDERMKRFRTAFHPDVVAVMLAELRGQPAPKPINHWADRARLRLKTLNYKGLNEASYQGAKNLIQELARIKMKPDRIVRTADNLISFWLSDGNKVRIEACEDGEFVLSILNIDGPHSHTEFKTASDVADELTREQMEESQW